jgi:hypothetical protein
VEDCVLVLLRLIHQNAILDLPDVCLSIFDDTRSF